MTADNNQNFTLTAEDAAGNENAGRLETFEMFGLVNKALDSVTRSAGSSDDAVLLAQASVLLTHYRALLEDAGRTLSIHLFLSRTTRDDVLVQYQTLSQRTTNLLTTIDNKLKTLA